MKDVKLIWEDWIKQEEENLQNKTIVKGLSSVKISYDHNDSKISIGTSKKMILTLIKHYKKDIEDFFSKRIGTRVSLEFQSELALSNSEPNKKESIIKKENISFGLSPKYSFDNFIVGDSNKEAYRAFSDFSKKNHHHFSPLFVYGGNGLGKTHLLNATGNNLQRKGYNVASLTSTKLFEKLTKQRFEKNKEKLFQEELKEYDVIIVDDIQLFEGKDKSLLVMFDVIDFFINHGKMIAVASDHSPNELLNFSDRLKSRLSSGLQIKIRDLDLTTAIKIVELKLKINPSKLKLPKEIIYFIAKNFGSDVRLIESVITRLDFLCLTIYNSTDITIDFVQSALKDMLKNKSKDTLASTIIEVVSRNYSVPMDMVVSPSRKSIYITPRHVSMYLIRKLTKLSFGQIGPLFGGKDQSSISSACEKIEKLRKKDIELNKKVKFIESTINKMFSKELN